VSTIFGLGLGKFKGVPCASAPATTSARFASAGLLEAERPGPVGFETRALAGWVADPCGELGLICPFVAPMGEARSWREVRRKTNEQAAPKLAGMAALGELPGVAIPSSEAATTAGWSIIATGAPRRRTALAFCRRRGMLVPCRRPHRFRVPADLAPASASGRYARHPS
jgi:hypothetical protein